MLGNYQAVDRTEFGTDGVTIGTGDSERNLTLIPSGLEFLFDRFDDTSFTVGCVAVVDNVNINRAESILVYRAGETHTSMLYCIYIQVNSKRGNIGISQMNYLCALIIKCKNFMWGTSVTI